MSLNQRDGSSSAPSPAALPQNSYQANSRADLVGLAFAVALPVLLVHLFVVKPMTTHLTQLRGQVTQLERQVETLSAQSKTAQDTASLLVSLTDQEETLDRAEEALARMAKIQRQLAIGLNQAELSMARLGKLDQFREQIDYQVVMIDQANRLTKQISTKLENVAANHSRVVASTDRIEAANESLDGLVTLEKRLNSPLMGTEEASERLDSLVALKESVLDETENLPDAFDTLELMVALNKDIANATRVFEPLQSMLADLVLLEPSIARIANLVEPMMQRSTVGEFEGTQLRLVLDELRRRHAQITQESNRETGVAKNANEESSSTSEVAALPQDETSQK